MRTLITSALAAVVIAAAPAGAQTVLTFDDIPCDNTPLTLYGGVNFNGQFTCYTSPQPPYTAHSGAGRIYDAISPSTFNFASPTTFSGAWFAGQPDATVQFELFFEGVMVGSSATLTTSETPMFLSGGYGGTVDAVSVVSNRPDFWVMDDLTFGAAVTTTPEPASLALFATGLMGLGGLTYRRRRDA